jgi:cephalosporin hydroxylase
MINTIYTQTGGIWPCGIPTSLSWLDIGAVLRIAHVSKARAIIEIGVECGGLAAQLAAYCAGTKTRYLGCDIRIDALDPTIDQTTILHANAHEPDTIQRVDQWLANQRYPTTLYICDGGDKPRELALYAPFVRLGDVMIGHDYRREYEDTALSLPISVRRITPAFLADTNWCMVVHRDDHGRAWL